MSELLALFIFIPILGFIVSLLVPDKNEALISQVTFGSIGIQLLGAAVYVGYWVITQHHGIQISPELEIYTSGDYQFKIGLYFDKITAMFLLLGAFLCYLVTIYSRYYLHRERGYKRFFNTVLFFYIGYNITILAGNFETLFIGWEILGISSFWLIAFYRDRYLPVKNALKVFFIYRFADIGLILTMWMSHHFWHKNISFDQFNNYDLVQEHLSQHTLIGVGISLMLLLAASAKSAQLPFSSWLPRAMEGPTPSSAIFYGALSVNMGVFLLLRTYPFWEHQISVRILIGLLGLTTALIATGISRVQSSVKSQIAYASIAQIGLIFIEMSLGWENLALFHCVGNALLRTYQLLASPSVVSYLIREQFYNFSPHHSSMENNFPKKIRYTLYMLSLREWNLDELIYRFLWHPFKYIGRRMNFLNSPWALGGFGVLYLIGVFILFSHQELPEAVAYWLPVLFAFIGLMMILQAFAERKKIVISWINVLMNHFWVALAVSYNEQFTYIHILLYLSGTIVFGAIGLACIYRLIRLESGISLSRFHGFSFKYPRFAFLFFVCCLGITGFPISPTFLGEDLIFSHIHTHQWLLLALVSMSFILDGLAIIRIFARLFLGVPQYSEQDKAYRSS